MEQKTEDFTPEEKIKNEIEVLKLKLEVENGAILHTSDSQLLPPEVELEWYNHIVNYEQMCKDAGYTSVYELIGSPAWVPFEELVPEERETKFRQLLDYMYEKGIALSFIENCYTTEVLYRFVTEELFNEQICRYRGPGGEGHSMFSYEDFHPNHSYDLFYAAQDWAELVFGETKWEKRFLEFTHEESVLLNHQIVELDDYAKKIIAFQKQYPAFLFSNKKTGAIEFDMDTKKAVVQGSVEMNGKPIPFTLRFQYDFLWTIAGLEMELLD